MQHEGGDEPHVTNELDVFDDLEKYLEHLAERDYTIHEVYEAISRALMIIIQTYPEEWGDLLGEIYGIGLHYGADPDYIDELYNNLIIGLDSE